MLKVCLLDEVMAKVIIILIAVENSQHLLFSPVNRVRTGHGKPGKSWNLRISFSGLESQIKTGINSK